MNPAIKTPLGQKLGLRLGMKISCINTPEHYAELAGIDDLLMDVQEIQDPGELDFVHLFATNAQELTEHFVRLKEKISMDGMLWVSWPKKSAGVSTDLNRELVRELGLDSGLVDVKVCSIDQTWSGLKFVYRTNDRKLVTNQKQTA